MSDNTVSAAMNDEGLLSYLYLLVDSSGLSFKIGVSVNTSQRINALPEDIDREKSFQFKFEGKKPYRVEKTLHLLFQDHRIQKDRADGFTEWFSIDCFDAAQEFIRNYQGLLGWTHIEPIPELSFAGINTSIKPSLTPEQRQVRKDQKRMAELVDDANKNSVSVNSFSEWVDALRKNGIQFGLFDNRGVLAVHKHHRNCPGTSRDVYYFGAIRFQSPRTMCVTSVVNDAFACANSEYTYMRIVDVREMAEAYLIEPESIGMTIDPIQALRNTVESIPTIPEPLINDVLVDYLQAKIEINIAFGLE